MQNYNQCRQYFRNLPNVDLRQSRLSYDYKSSFLAARRDDDYDGCDARQEL